MSSAQAHVTMSPMIRTQVDKNTGHMIEEDIGVVVTLSDTMDTDDIITWVYDNIGADISVGTSVGVFDSNDYGLPLPPFFKMDGIDYELRIDMVDSNGVLHRSYGV